MKKLYKRVGEIVAARPNWGDTVREEYQYNTVVHTSHDGTEQREALWKHPRRTVEFRSDNFGPLARRIAADMKRWPSGGIRYLPIHWRYAKLAATAATGATTIGLDRAPPWWMKAGVSLVLEGGSTQELVEVSAVGAFSVSLVSATTEPFDSGDKVILAERVRYPSENSLTSLTSEHRQSNFRFEVDPGPVDLSDLPGATGYHEGVEIFLKNPNWTQSVSSRFQDQRETLDLGIGAIEVDRFRDFTVQQETLTYLARTREQADYFIGLFARSRGARMPFWIPSFLHDADAVGDGFVGTNTLVIAGTDFADEYTDDDTYSTIVVRTPAGGYQFNRITGVSVSGDNSVLTVVNAWTGTIPLGAQVSFGFLARMVNDTLVVDWQTDSVAEITATVKALPNRFLTLGKGFGPFYAPEITGSLTTDFVDGNHLAVNLEAVGVPLSAVDRGEVYISWVAAIRIGLTPLYQEVTGETVGNSLFQVDVKTFDADGISTPMVPTNMLVFNDFVGIASLGLGGLLPPGSRIVRFRQLINLGGLGDVIELREVEMNISSPDWGLGYDIGDEQWP
jgi:hypothetical protein